MAFTASNGVTVAKKGSSSLAVERPMTDRMLNINAERTSALREFFQHERDEELGRWRWPENPQYVVYTEGDGAVVVDERDGNRAGYSRSICATTTPPRSDGIHSAVHAFFDSHPDPKPWHDAKTGEVWVLAILDGDSSESAWTVNNEGEFEDPNSTYELTNRNITDGRKIWPEPS